MLFLPDGKPYKSQLQDIQLLGIVWRGSNVVILSDKDTIQRLDYNDRRKVAEELKRVFEQDFGPNIYL